MSRSDEPAADEPAAAADAKEAEEEEEEEGEEEGKANAMAFARDLGATSHG